MPEFSRTIIQTIKMKNLFLAAAALLISLSSFAQEKKVLSPRALVKSQNLEVSYGQPSKRNRVIFGELVPYGNVWRAGANEATEVTFKKDAKFGGKQVPAGKYTLYVIPNEKEWKIVLNSELGQWGAYEYEKNQSKNVAEITVPTETLDKTQEQLVYEYKKDNLTIQWDKTGVSIPVEF